MSDQKEDKLTKSLFDSGVKKLTLINSKNIEIDKKRTEEKMGQKSIVEKIIQNKLASSIQYQDHLIQIKQIQLQLLDADQIFSNLNKLYKKENQKVIDLKQKIQKEKQVLFQKQKYLQNYYVHLDNKFKNNINSQLFGKLQKLQHILQQKYQKLKQQLSQSLNNQNQKSNQFIQQLSNLRSQRDQLTKSILNKAFDESQRAHSQYQDSQIKFKQSEVSSQIVSNNSVKSSQQRKKQEYKKRKQQIKQERENLKRNIKKLKKQKQIIESQEKMLKLLLNIDQQHKKHSYLIINGLRKMIMINHRNILFKKIKTLKQDTPSKQYLNLKEDINIKLQQRQNLKQELAERINNLQIIKQKLNQQIGQYSQLEAEIMRNSNRISHDQFYRQERQSSNNRSYNSDKRQ